MQWSPQQDQALKAVSAWLKDPTGPQVFRLFGWAGTGKSTLAMHLAAGLKKKVEYAAFTGKAALVMRKRGCPGASTIHSLIYMLENEEGGEPKFLLNEDSSVRNAGLVVIDEVSMVDSTLGSDLLSFGTKVLVLGDPFQLPPVSDAESFFCGTKPDIMLTEIHRQAADNPIIRMSMDIREGNGLQYGTYGDSRVISRREVNLDDVLAAEQILVGRNKTRTDYNSRVRLRKGIETPVPVAGEKVICLRNNRQKNLLNGQMWIVKRVDTTRKRPEVLKMLLDPEDVEMRSMDVKVTSHQHFFNGTEDKFANWNERRAFDEFTFGYCCTVHKAQGSQWDNVYLFDESFVFREDQRRHQYTAVTRAAKRITVVS